MFQAQDIDLRNLPFNDNLVYMQYTGLKDKNGNEIYEGDILYMPAFSPEKNIVRFNRGGFCLEPVLAAPLESSFWPDIKYAEDEGSEVIGNIYENPELLVNN
jgi:hypothetical protein